MGWVLAKIIFKISGLGLARTSPGNSGCLGFACAILQHKRSVEVGGAEDAVFFHFGASAFGEAVQAQIVFLQFDLGQELPLEGLELHQVHLAFEDGLLDALAGAFAHFGNPSEASSPCLGFCIDVVADDDKHGGVLSEG